VLRAAWGGENLLDVHHFLLFLIRSAISEQDVIVEIGDQVGASP
tara:strand:+ start:521 stop:652 length:132 start_codon:yes stop_codon:yes gene_type:complete